MLLSMIIQLKPCLVGTLPPSTGKALHAVFLNWLRSADPILSQELHDIDDIKPFTVSGLSLLNDNPLPGYFPKDLTLHPRNSYWFRVTSLNPELSARLLHYFQRADRPPFPAVLGREFSVSAISFQPEEHPWAGITSYAELVTASLKEPPAGKNSKNGGKVTLNFCSPTTFKSDGRSLPIPLPMQTFSSLMKRWNRFSPYPLDEVFLSFLEETVSISGYELKSEMVWLDGSKGGAKLVAFQGWCEYTCFSRNEDWVKAVDLLSRFAFFSGVGYKTGWGFGQTIASNTPPGR